MAKRKLNIKQKEWNKLQKRIQQRYAKGYRFSGKEFKYEKLTAKQIKSLTRSELDKYFLHVDEETGEILTPKEYRREERKKRELGYTNIPQETISPNRFDTIEAITRVINEIPKVLMIFSPRSHTVIQYRYEERFPFLSIMKLAISVKTMPVIEQYYEEHQDELVTALTVWQYASDEDQISAQFSRALELLKGGEPLTMLEAQEIGEMLDNLEGE